MKIAKDIKKAVYEQVDYDLDTSCFTGWDEVESIIAGKLEPIKNTIEYVLSEEEWQMGKVSIDCLEGILGMLREE